MSAVDRPLSGFEAEFQARSPANENPPARQTLSAANDNPLTTENALQADGCCPDDYC